MGTTETEECVREEIVEKTEDREAFLLWVQEGIDRGFVTHADCAIHGNIYTEEQWEQFDEGEDPCQVVIVIAPDYQ